jgi:hypothetical protein
MALAESTNDTYIERYPGDGMGQRDRKVPAKRLGESGLERLLPEKGSSVAPPETAQPSGTNTSTRAARYISPRVGSKEFAPSRLADPKPRQILIRNPEAQVPARSRTSDKVGVVSTVITNASSSTLLPVP